MHYVRICTAFVGTLLLSLSLHAQSKTVEKFVSENQSLQKYFIYQSTLRLLNPDGDPDFNRLIKDIRKINVYVADEGNAVVSTAGYRQMVSNLQEENFETLMSAKMQGALVNLMMKEQGNTGYYVLTGAKDNDFILLEMDGQLDLRYLQSLENVNFMKLGEIVGLDNQPKQEQHEENHD